MTRRAIAISLLAAGLALADASADAFDAIASMAAGLSADNAAAFLKAVDPHMAGRERLAADVRGLLEQAEVTCAISKLEDEGDDARRTLVLDWSLDLKRKGGDDLRIERRRQAVRMTLARSGKKWLVTSLEPASFFAPPDFR